MSYRGIQGEVVGFTAHNGDKGEGYFARPTEGGKFGSVVLIHHMPGWDEYCVEATRKLAHHGFLAFDPNLYFRAGSGSPDDQAAAARSAGGLPDAQVVGDVKGSMEFLRKQQQSNGKVGVIGFCSGGRHTYLAACLLPNVDAAVDCWGGNVVVDDPKNFDANRPVAPIDYTERLTCPLLGIFGNDDKNPSPAHVNKLEEKLKQYGKNYEFHRYDGAGHGFFAWSRPNYRPEQAMDAWDKVLAFFHKHLG
jgi:carboxymethylenebutenolidase